MAYCLNMGAKPALMKILRIALITAFALVFSQCKKDRQTIRNDNVTAHDFLSASSYEKLIVEVQYMDGYQPTAEAVNNLIALLQKRLNKPGGILISENRIPAQGKSFYTEEEIKAIEKT